MSTPLHDAHRKVDRARKHLRDLNDQLRALDDTKAHRVVVDYDPDRRCHVTSLVQWGISTSTAEMALTAGDAIHNLRNALDFIAWRLALREKSPVEPTEHEARQIQFPITDNPKWFASSKTLLHVSRLAAQELALHQPYATPLGGPHDPSLLRIVRDLNNRDKHRLLLQRGASYGVGAANPPLNYKFEPPVSSYWTEPVKLPDQETFQIFTTSRTIPFERVLIKPSEVAAHTKADVDPQPPLRPLFGGPFRDVDIPRLEALADCVEFVIGRFDRYV